MWGVLASLLLLFAAGRAILFFLDRLTPPDTFSRLEVVVYSFSLGYAVLAIVGTVAAQFGLLTPSASLLIVLILPILAVGSWVHRARAGRSPRMHAVTREDLPLPTRNLPQHFRGLLASVRRHHIILLVVFAAGLGLRLETQLTVPWLGDQDPYYHLSFIDAIVAHGTLPARTFWGAYAYPPSFHVVFATLISATHADRYLLMKIVPEFLGFLCVPAVYALLRRRYGHGAGIAAAAFLAIGSYHIYRTNIAIPEPIALLAMLLFFHAMTTQHGPKQYLLAGLSAATVFLTNAIAILYFLPCVAAIIAVSLIVRQRTAAVGYLKTTSAGLALSAVFWLPTLYRLGVTGILDGLGPSYPYSGVLAFTSHTYFAWIGWGACLFAAVGLYVCLHDLRNSLTLLLPTAVFVFLTEAANNGYLLLEANILFRSLLFLGTWIALLAGVGVGRALHTKRKTGVAIAAAIIVILTAAAFPVVSGTRYPVNWGYDDADFVYRSYRQHYAAIFDDQNHTVYAAFEYSFNYGAFGNVLLDKEAPQIGDALRRGDASTVNTLIREYKIHYLILHTETPEAEFLLQSNLTYTYYANWQTTVFAVE